MAEPSAGYLSLPVTLGSSESTGIFNEAGLDIDFRVESNINEYGLFLDATDGNVGINQSVPSATLDVNGDVKISGSLNAGGSTGTSGQVLSSTGTGLQWITNSGGGGILDLEGGVVVNDNGAIVDFRVESDTNENMLFVDGNTDRVGIKTNTPAADFDVNGNVQISGSLNAGGSTGTSGQVLTSTGTGISWADASSGVDFEGGVVINDNAADVDFRVEGVGQGNALFVQGSDGAVGIKTNIPAADFDVNGDVKISGSLNAGGSTGTSGQVLTSTGTGISWADASGGGGGADFEGGVVINDNAADVDFRVEGVGQANALFVQGSDGNVGVGTGTPSYPMHVYAGASGTTAESGFRDMVIESDTNAGMTIATPSNRYATIQLRNSSTSRYTMQMGFNTVVHKIHHRELMRLGHDTGVVFNEGGVSFTDFRIESDLRTHAFFLQASDGAIGINTNTPAADLDVNGDVVISGGLLMGSATGGDKGAGTINATAVYDDDTLLTDFVLDQAVDGEIDYEFYDSLELGGHAARAWDPRNLDIDFYEAQWRERRSLPAFMTKEERLDSDGNEIRDSIGKLVQGLQQELETAHVHIAQLNKRLKELEEKL